MIDPVLTMVSGYTYYYGAIKIDDIYKLLQKDIPELVTELTLRELQEILQREVLNEDSIYFFNMDKDIIYYLNVFDYPQVLTEQGKRALIDYLPVKYKDAVKLVKAGEDKLWSKPEKALYKWFTQQGWEGEEAQFKVLEITSIMRNNIPLPQLIDFVLETYNIEDMKEAQNVADLISEVWNNIPRWELKGWTANDIFEQHEHPNLWPLPDEPFTFDEEQIQPAVQPAELNQKPVGRNQPCPCGSGKKYKHCCLQRDEAALESEPQAIRPNIGSNRSRSKEGDFYVSRSDYQALIEAFERFVACEPWNWMSNLDIFAVELSEGEVYYICVMGYGGEVFGLAVYQGEEGLDYYIRQLIGEVRDSDFTSLGPCILLSWGKRKELLPEEQSLYKKMGYSFTGSRWPVFRRYEPGFYPWKLQVQDVLHSTRILEQSLFFVQHCQKHRRQWTNRFKKDQIPWCREVRDEAELEKKLKWKEKQEPVLLTHRFVFNEVEAMQLKNSLPQKDNAWELDWFFQHQPVQDSKKEVPWFPIITAIGSAETGIIMNFKTSGCWDLDVPGFLMDNMRKMKYIPLKLQVNSFERAEEIEDFCRILGIELEVWESLYIDEFRREM